MSRLGKISLIFAALSLIIFGIAKYILGAWIPFFWILLGMIVFFISAAVAVDRKFWAEFVTLKTTKHGMNMGVLILLVLSLMIIANYIGVKNNRTWDFSSTQSSTLSEQSIKVLKSLDSELKILFFYKRGAEGTDENRKAFREIIKKYQDQTDKIKLDFYEVNENLGIAEQYGVTKGSGVAFLDYKGKRNRIEKVDEQEITSALIKVTRTSNKTVYFVTGHKELDLEEGKDPAGMNLFKLLLENNSFNIKTWNLITQPQIPENADVVALVGSVQSFADYEVKLLEDYLRKGGQLFIALEAPYPASLKKFFSNLGLEPQNNFIKSSFMGMGFVDGGAVGSEFSNDSSVTSTFHGKQEIARFGWPMNIKLIPTMEGITTAALVSTTKDAVAFPRPEILGTNYPPGPFNLVVLSKGKYLNTTGEKDYAAIVAGDAEFLNNGMLYQNLNRDLGLAIISSLAREENLISILPREVEKTVLRNSTVTQSFFMFGVIIPVPILLLLASLMLWMRRRNA